MGVIWCKNYPKLGINDLSKILFFEEKNAENCTFLIAIEIANSPVSQNARPVRLRLPVTQKTTKSLKTLLVSHAKTFEMTKQT